MSETMSGTRLNPKELELGLLSTSPSNNSSNNSPITSNMKASLSPMTHGMGPSITSVSSPSMMRRKRTSQAQDYSGFTLEIGGTRVTAIGDVGFRSPMMGSNPIGSTLLKSRVSRNRASKISFDPRKTESSINYIDDTMEPMMPVSSTVDYIADSHVVGRMSKVVLRASRKFRSSIHKIEEDSMKDIGKNLGQDDENVSKDDVSKADVSKDDEDDAFVIIRVWVSKILIVVLAFSSTISLVNFTKMLFATFPFPLFTTTLHMTFAFVMSCTALRFEILGVPKKDNQVDLSFIEALEIIGPFCIFGAISIAFGNMALVHIQPGFHEMLQNMTPMWNILLAKFCSQKIYNWQAYAALVPLCLAAIVTAKGESSSISFLGFLFSNLTAIFRSLRLIIQETMLCSKDVSNANDGTSNVTHPESQKNSSIVPPSDSPPTDYSSTQQDYHAGTSTTRSDNRMTKVIDNDNIDLPISRTQKFLRSMGSFVEPLRDEREISFGFNPSPLPTPKKNRNTTTSTISKKTSEKPCSRASSSDNLEEDVFKEDDLEAGEDSTNLEEDILNELLETSSNSEKEDENRSNNLILSDMMEDDGEENEKASRKSTTKSNKESTSMESNNLKLRNKKTKRTRQAAVAEIKRMDTITLLYYSCPMNAGIFLCASLILEGLQPWLILILPINNNVSSNTDFSSNTDYFIIMDGTDVIISKSDLFWSYFFLFASAIVAALFNIFSFLLVQEFGAVLSQVIGQLKTPVMLLIAACGVGGAEVSILQVYGFLLSASGCFFYKKYARESIDPAIPEGGYVMVLIDYLSKIYESSNYLSKVFLGVKKIALYSGLSKIIRKMYFGSSEVSDFSSSRGMMSLNVGQNIMLPTGELITVKATKTRVDGGGNYVIHKARNTVGLSEMFKRSTIINHLGPDAAVRHRQSCHKKQ